MHIKICRIIEDWDKNIPNRSDHIPVTYTTCLDKYDKHCLLQSYIPSWRPYLNFMFFQEDGTKLGIIYKVMKLDSL